MRQSRKPADVTRGELQRAFEVLNAGLFGGLLPDCLITLQRKSSQAADAGA